EWKVVLEVVSELELVIGHESRMHAEPRRRRDSSQQGGGIERELRGEPGGERAQRLANRRRMLLVRDVRAARAEERARTEDERCEEARRLSGGGARWNGFPSEGRHACLPGPINEWRSARRRRRRERERCARCRLDRRSRRKSHEFLRSP